MLPGNFSFSCPTKIHSGDGALNHLPYELGCLDVAKPLVLTQRQFTDAGMLDALSAGLTGFGAFGVCDEVPASATDDDIKSISAVYEGNGCDGLIALGSGALVNTVKRLKAALNAGGGTRHAPLVVVPCIGGSRGLECTGLTGAPAGASMALAPVLAVIDRRTLPAVPAKETALAALAALTIALETAVSPRRNPMTGAYARAALGQLRRFITADALKPGDAYSRIALATALASAGCAMTSTGEGAALVLGRSAGRLFSADPDVSAAVVMLAVLRRASAEHPEWVAELLWDVAGASSVAQTPRSDQPAAVVDTVNRWAWTLLTAAAPDWQRLYDDLATQDAKYAVAAGADDPGDEASSADAAYISILEDMSAAPSPGAGLAAAVSPQDRTGYFEFGCRVQIVAGRGMLERIPLLLSELGARRPMIVTDKGVAAAGIAQIVTRAVSESMPVGAVVDDVPPDSDLKMVNTLAGRYRESLCDALIAVGGGSVLDTAKGINMVVSENADDLMVYSGVGNLKHPLRPLIAVPTTAGTGSEVTQVAVIAEPARHRKMLFSSYYLQPDVAVLDPRMTLTLPAAITAATAMDAMAHAVEAYYSLAKNPLSDAAAFTAVDLISRHLLPVVAAPEDADGRLALALAATLAGMAFSNAPVAMVHAMGHSVGSVCGVPHGVCMAIGLPYGLEYNLHRIGAVAGELLLPLAGPEVFSATPVQDRPDDVIAWIRKFNDDLHTATGGKHPRCFRDVRRADGRPAVPRECLAEIAAVALGDGTLVYNPEDLDAADFLMVLEAAWEGIPLDRSRIRRG